LITDTVFIQSAPAKSLLSTPQPKRVVIRDFSCFFAAAQVPLGVDALLAKKE
jgi:hypothetical protein